MLAIKQLNKVARFVAMLAMLLKAVFVSGFSPGSMKDKPPTVIQASKRLLFGYHSHRIFWQ
jgi:hypothetical protein